MFLINLIKLVVNNPNIFIFNRYSLIFQIFPKMELKVPNRFYSNIMRRGKNIIMWLAIADFCASLGIIFTCINQFKLILKCRTNCLLYSLF